MNTPKPLALLLADRLKADIITGIDWPNSDDELLRLQAAEELERLHSIVNGPGVDPAAVLAAAGVVA